ncbi:MAG: hypothetical protein ACYCOU_01630 [Sulfobacillus sp.]
MNISPDIFNRFGGFGGFGGFGNRFPGWRWRMRQLLGNPFIA